jgi:hypothetical protein
MSAAPPPPGQTRQSPFQIALQVQPYRLISRSVPQRTHGLENRRG